MRVTTHRMESHPRRPGTSPVYRVTVSSSSHRGDPWKLSYLIDQEEFDDMKSSVMEADNDNMDKLSNDREGE